MSRGRTITTWGQAFTPLAISHGTQFVPPVIPPVEDVADGAVWMYPVIDRRLFLRWQREVRDFWIDYLQEVLQLTEAQARLRATEIMKAADTVDSKRPTKAFWRKYFVQARDLQNMALMIDLDDEEILHLL